MAKSGLNEEPFPDFSDEVLETIEKVVNNVASKYKFGYFDLDDIKQEGRVFAMK